MNTTSNRRLDAFDQWCLRHILYVFRIQLMSPIRKSPQLSRRDDRVCSDILSLHSRSVTRPHKHVEAINRPPADWRRTPGRSTKAEADMAPHIELDVQPRDLNTAWIAQNGDNSYRRLCSALNISMPDDEW